MVDTGIHMFFGGKCFFRQIDTLAMSCCVAKELPDGEWDAYIQAGYILSKKYGQPTKVSMAMFTDAIPTAAQRGRLATHLKTQRIPQLSRVAVITDSAIIRGALTAFGWVLPRTTMRAFDETDVPNCLKWLHDGAPFDQPKAAAAWSEGRRLVGLDP